MTQTTSNRLPSPIRKFITDLTNTLLFVSYRCSVCSGNKTENECDELQAKRSKGAIDSLLERSMTKRERDVVNRRAVIDCIMHPAPFNMVTREAFKLLIDSLTSQLYRETLHPSTIDAIIDELHWEVDASISSILRCQRKSCLRLGWRGPFVAVQADLTSVHSKSHATMTFSLVPE